MSTRRVGLTGRQRSAFALTTETRASHVDKERPGRISCAGPAARGGSESSLCSEYAAFLAQARDSAAESVPPPLIDAESFVLREPSSPIRRSAAVRRPALEVRRQIKFDESTITLTDANRYAHRRLPIRLPIRRSGLYGKGKSCSRQPLLAVDSATTHTNRFHTVCVTLSSLFFRLRTSACPT